MLLFLSLACAPQVTLYDGLVDGTPTALDPVTLAPEYLAGATFELAIEAGNSEVGDFTIEAVDSDVLALDLDHADIRQGHNQNSSIKGINAEAIGLGETEIIVRDSTGAEVLRGSVKVGLPTEIEAIWDDERLGVHDDVVVSEPLVCVGGDAGFILTYLDGDEELSGTSNVEVSGQRTTNLVPDAQMDTGNFIRLTPTESGKMDLVLSSGHFEVGAFAAVAVEREEIAEIQIVQDSEEGASEGDNLSVLAEAFDASGERIFGVPFGWAEDSVALEGNGDLYNYTFSGDEVTALTTMVNRHEVASTIHGSGEVGASSMACAVANVGPIGAAVALALLGVSRRRSR